LNIGRRTTKSIIEERQKNNEEEDDAVTHGNMIPRREQAASDRSETQERSHKSKRKQDNIYGANIQF